MERLLRNISHIVFSHHKLIVVIFSILTVVSLLMILNMEIKTDIIDVLPRGNETVNRFKEFTEMYGVFDTITLIVQSSNPSINEYIDIIENISLKLKSSSLIEEVDYSPLKLKNDLFVKYFPFFLDDRGLKQLEKRLSPAGINRQVRLNRQRLLSPFSSPLDYELINKDPLDLRGIIAGSIKRSGRDESLDISSGYYFSKDHTMALIFAKPKGKSKDVSFVKKLKEELDKNIYLTLKESGNPADIRISYTGSHTLMEEVRRVIAKDITGSFVLSAFLIAFLIWIAYRVRIAVLLIIGFTLLASLSMTLAFAYMIFGSLNIVTSITAVVLIGLYVDYAMVTLKRYADELRSGSDAKRALKITVTKSGSAIAISALTSSLSFFSIMATRFEGLYELGLVAGIGVLMCLVSTLFLMNSLLFLASRKGWQNIVLEKETHSGIELLIQLVLKRPRHIIIFSVILLLIAGFGIGRLIFDNDPDHIGLKDSRSIAAGKALREKLNRKTDPLVISAKGRSVKDVEANFDLLEGKISSWKKEGFIGSYESLSMFLPPPSSQNITLSKIEKMRDNNAMQPDKIKKMLATAMENDGFVYDGDYIRAYLDKIVTALNSAEPIDMKDIEGITDRRIRHFYNSNDTSIAAYIYPPGNTWDKQTLTKLGTDIRSLGKDWAFFGKPVLFGEIKSSIITGSILAVFLTFISNIGIIYWHFRNIRHVFLTMMPVTIGFFLTLGFAGHFNIPFNFINVGTIALIFGFGVDYGIYVMQAYLKEKANDVGNALRLTGRNVVMCAATTVAGCGSLITAQFAGIASIGSILIIGAVSCAFAALVLLPAMLTK